MWHLTLPQHPSVGFVTYNFVRGESYADVFSIANYPRFDARSGLVSKKASEEKICLSTSRLHDLYSVSRANETMQTLRVLNVLRLPEL